MAGGTWTLDTEVSAAAGGLVGHPVGGHASATTANLSNFKLSDKTFAYSVAKGALLDVSWTGAYAWRARERWVSPWRPPLPARAAWHCFHGMRSPAPSQPHRRSTLTPTTPHISHQSLFLYKQACGTRATTRATRRRTVRAPRCRPCWRAARRRPRPWPSCTPRWQRCVAWLRARVWGVGGWVAVRCASGVAACSECIGSGGTAAQAHPRYGFAAQALA